MTRDTQTSEPKTPEVVSFRPSEEDGHFLAQEKKRGIPYTFTISKALTLLRQRIKKAA